MEDTLELASTKELILELKKRHDTGVIVLHKQLTGDSDDFLTFHFGSNITALGMAMTAKKIIERNIQ